MGYIRSNEEYQEKIDEGVRIINQFGAPIKRKRQSRLALLSGSESNDMVLHANVISKLEEGLAKAYPDRDFGIGTFHMYRYGEYWIHDFAIQSWTAAQAKAGYFEMVSCSVREDFRDYTFVIIDHPFYHNPSRTNKNEPD